VQLAAVDGIQLEFEDRGSGEPIVFIHGSLFGDVFAPLLAEPELRDRYRLIRYHRRGYGLSSHPNRPISIADQAEDCRLLLHQLGVASAHVVGYSYGGSISLQLALDAPDVVKSLVLLEPPLLSVPSVTEFVKKMAPAVRLFESGDRAAAVDVFMRVVFGKDFRQWLHVALPGASSEANATAAILFLQEWPSLGQWRFGPLEARSITRPALAVLGQDTAKVAPIFAEGHQQLLEWLPQVESFRLAGAGHGLPLQKPQSLATRLVAFLADHSRRGSAATVSTRAGTLPKRR
jgi:pimeloyl-ACP methyl ester carboxylesterase